MAHDAHVTDPTKLLTAQDQTVTAHSTVISHRTRQLLKTQYCGITLDQTVTEHTVLWHHTGPDNY